VFASIKLAVRKRRGESKNGQRLPKSLFQAPTSLLFQNFWIRVLIQVRQFFKF